jgi:hypothetical protein
VSVVVNHLFSAGPAFERMSDGFRPAMTPVAIAQLQANLGTLEAVGPEFETKGITMVAQALGMTPEQLTAFIGQQYPDVATGLQQLPSIVAQFRGVVGVLAIEQTRFERADAIPASNLPATTIPWGLLVAGIALVGIGLTVAIRPIRPWAVAALAVGALMVVAPLAMSLPTKASAADTMNAHLEPVYSAQMLTGRRVPWPRWGRWASRCRAKCCRPSDGSSAWTRRSSRRSSARTCPP